jgi:hypothetical protein
MNMSKTYKDKEKFNRKKFDDDEEFKPRPKNKKPKKKDMIFDEDFTEHFGL